VYWNGVDEKCEIKWLESDFYGQFFVMNSYLPMLWRIYDELEGNLRAGIEYFLWKGLENMAKSKVLFSQVKKPKSKKC
jgi:hypothetical protein